MILYCDGYCLESNPSEWGGGFTVFNNKNKLIYTEQILKKGFTNNEAELLGIHQAAKLAKKRDTIITDSQNCIWWIRKGFSKARPDLDKVILESQKCVIGKKLKLIWQPREFNLAGIYNEEQSFD